MRARRDFAKHHIVATDKQLNAEQAVAAECQHHLARDRLRALQRQRAHLLRLPGLTVVAIFLTVADWRAKVHAVYGVNGQ